jgi:hypothetical protein
LKLFNGHLLVPVDDGVDPEVGWLKSCSWSWAAKVAMGGVDEGVVVVGVGVEG